MFLRKNIKRPIFVFCEINQRFVLEQINIYQKKFSEYELLMFDQISALYFSDFIFVCVCNILNAYHIFQSNYPSSRAFWGSSGFFERIKTRVELQSKCIRESFVGKARNLCIRENWRFVRKTWWVFQIRA